MEERKAVPATWHDMLAFTIALYKVILPPVLIVGLATGLVGWLLVGVWMN